MKKIILLTIVLTVITGMAVFANGEQEGSFDRAVRPWNMYDEEPELMSLSGTLQLEYGERPTLLAGGEAYELMYPPFLDDGIDIENGEAVTIEGFLVPGPRWSTDDEENYLHVTKAVIDGEEYELDRIAGGYGAMAGGRSSKRAPGYSGRSGFDDGRRGGMMDGRYGDPRGNMPGGGYNSSRGRR